MTRSSTPDIAVFKRTKAHRMTQRARARSSRQGATALDGRDLSVAILGAGKVSETYALFLTGEVCYVDPRSHRQQQSRYGSVVEIPATTRDAIDLWIICTPTETHLRCIAEILAVAPRARIIVEKPIIELRDFSALECLLSRHPGCRIVENNQYERSGVIPRLAAVLAARGLLPHTRLKELYIEFTKNRLCDNDSGRFRDHYYGLFGYEGSHLLALANSAFEVFTGSSIYEGTSGVACHYRSQMAHRAADEGTLAADVTPDRGPRVTLYTSMCGEIGDPRIANLTRGRRGDQARAFIERGDPERYRVVRLAFEDRTIYLRCEPQPCAGRGLVRNQYAVWEQRDRAIEPVATFEMDIFEMAFRRNVAILSCRPFRQTAILDESRNRLEMIARVATAVSSYGVVSAIRDPRSAVRYHQERRSSSRTAARATMAMAAR